MAIYQSNLDAYAAGLGVIEMVTIDITSAPSFLDPNGLVSGIVYNAGTGYNDVSYQNTSGIALDGALEGYMGRFTLASVLPGFDIDAGDGLLVRATAQAGTSDWHDFGVGVGLYETAVAQAAASGLAGFGTTSYQALLTGQSASTRSSAIAYSLATSEVQSYGVVMVPPGAYTNTDVVITAGMAQIDTTATGVSMGANGKLAANTELIVALTAQSNVNRGARVASVKLEVGRIPFPA